MATLSPDQQRIIISSLMQYGTFMKAAKDALTTTPILQQYRKQHPKFSRLCQDAISSGKESVGDNALTVIQGIAFGKDTKDQQRLVAAMSLANAFVPGFKGTTHVEGRIQHNVQVSSLVPRPPYIQGQCIDVTPKMLEQPSTPKLSPIEKRRLYQRTRIKEIRHKAKEAKTSLQLVAVG